MLILRFKGFIELSLCYFFILKVKLFCRMISIFKVCVGEVRVRLFLVFIFFLGLLVLIVMNFK